MPKAKTARKAIRPLKPKDKKRFDLDLHKSILENLEIGIANLQNERYCELVDTHSRSIRPLLMAILEAQDEPWDKDKQFYAISWHLAAVLSNPCLPDRLRSQISDGITEFHNDVKVCFESPAVLRAGGFVPLLAAGFDAKSVDPVDLP